MCWASGVVAMEIWKIDIEVVAMDTWDIEIGVVVKDIEMGVVTMEILFLLFYLSPEIYLLQVTLHDQNISCFGKEHFKYEESGK